MPWIQIWDLVWIVQIRLYLVLGGPWVAGKLLKADSWWYNNSILIIVGFSLKCSISKLDFKRIVFDKTAVPLLSNRNHWTVWIPNVGIWSYASSCDECGMKKALSKFQNYLLLVGCMLLMWTWFILSGFFCCTTSLHSTNQSAFEGEVSWPPGGTQWLVC